MGRRPRRLKERREGTGMVNLKRELASNKTNKQKKLPLEQRRKQKGKLKRKLEGQIEKQRKRQIRSLRMLRKTDERRRCQSLV